MKFLKTNEDSDNDEVEYEVGRTKWLVGSNSKNDYIDKKLTILWPPKSSMVCNAVKMDKDPDSLWRIEQVQIKKLYSMLKFFLSYFFLTYMFYYCNVYLSKSLSHR